jgi:type III secretory pathway component EscR
MHVYWLGCPMSEAILNKFEELLLIAKSSVLDEEKNSFTSIEKENLILIDYDFFKDYPTEFPLKVHLAFNTKDQNPEYEVIFLTGAIPPEKMPFLLQRAKIIIDLAMPGPERISSEGILFGAIPIISNLWNGASGIDFPVKHKINLFNLTKSLLPVTSTFTTDPIGTALEETMGEDRRLVSVNSEISFLIQTILENYDEEIKEYKHYQFLQYILSMEKRLSNTADVFFGSSKITVVIIARTLEEEYCSIFQILGLIFVYPMVTIDLIVRDKVWFMRHHYLFVDLLVQSGYLRYDYHDPDDHLILANNVGDPRVSFVRIFTMSELFEPFPTGRNSLARERKWKTVIFQLPTGFIPLEDNSLFYFIQQAEEVTEKQIILSQTKVANEPLTELNPFFYFKYNFSMETHSAKFLKLIMKRHFYSEETFYDSVFLSKNLSLNTIHICELFHLSLPKTPGNNDLVFDVTDSPSWLVMKHQVLEITEKFCEDRKMSFSK